MKPRQLNDNDRSVLGALGDSSKPLSAYDILDRARSDTLKAPVQVYRALEKLEEKGLVHRIEALNAFVACADHEHPGHRPGFVICRDCRSVREFEDERVAQVADGRGRRGLRRRSRVARSLRPLRRPARRAMRRFEPRPRGSDAGAGAFGARMAHAGRRRRPDPAGRLAAHRRCNTLKFGMNAELTFQDLTLGYDRHPAVHHLDGTVAAGSLTAVVGPNGSGKSTLLKGIVGILKPLGGRIVRSELAATIAYLPQHLGDRPHVPGHA